MDRHRRAAGKWLGGTALLCLALAACNKAPQATTPAGGAPAAALQLTTAPPPPPAYAPPASALPPAPRAVSYRPSAEHWRYLTDAYDMSNAFADTPPDYTVDYDGESPYVWRADNGAYRVVEWLPDGARYYYYEPGADEPFLIQDPEYSYAYDNGALIAVYTLAGALVADRIAAEREGYAARYYGRGHELYRAAVNDRRRAAYSANWQQRAPVIQAQRQRWQRGREAQPGWRDWSRAHQPQQDARWAPERRHRAAYAASLGAATTGGIAYAAHRRNGSEDQHAAERRPEPQAPVQDHGRRTFPGATRPNPADHRADARQDTASPAQPDRHGANPEAARAESARQHQAAQAANRPPAVPHDRTAEHQAIAHAEQVQQHQAKQARQMQQHELQQAQQAQHHEAQQVVQAQRSEAQARAQQGRQARHAAAQAQRAQIHVEARTAPPPLAASRPRPSHLEAAHKPAPGPAPQPQQPHNPGDRGGQKDNRHHH